MEYTLLNRLFIYEEKRVIGRIEFFTNNSEYSYEINFYNENSVQVSDGDGPNYVLYPKYRKLAFKEYEECVSSAEKFLSEKSCFFNKNKEFYKKHETPRQEEF